VTLHHIKTRAQKANTIRRMQQAGAGWHVPLLRAAMAGDLRQFATLEEVRGAMAGQRGSEAAQDAAEARDAR
jgi:hypothetical protein